MAFQKLSTAFKLVKVAQRRKRGDGINIATETGYSPSYVSKVLYGLRNNESIVNTAYRMAYRRETLATKLSSINS